MPKYETPYVYLMKGPVANQTLLFVVVHIKKTARSVQFGAPGSIGQATQIDINIVDDDDAMPQAYTWLYTLENGPGQPLDGDNVIHLFLNGALSLRWGYNDADTNNANPVGARAINCPYVTLGTSASQPNSRYPHITIPCNALQENTALASTNYADPLIEKGEVTLIPSMAGTKWLDASINGIGYNLNLPIDPAAKFQMKVKVQNGAAVTTTTSTVRSQYYVQNPGIKWKKRNR